jgi:hypothetical protein
MKYIHWLWLVNYMLGPLWSWSYGSWIYNYICSQCLSSLMLWVWISIRARHTTLCDKVCQWLAKGRWFSLCIPVSSTNKTDCHDITEILFKVALNTIKQTNRMYECRLEIMILQHVDKCYSFPPQKFGISFKPNCMDNKWMVPLKIDFNLLCWLETQESQSMVNDKLVTWKMLRVSLDGSKG